MKDTVKAQGLFLGLDCSTQALKATVIDPELRVVCEDGVSFDNDLPEFGTQGGVHRHADGLTVTSPPLMWVAALDLLLGRMKGRGRPLADVAAVSGGGQQHGSVWLKSGARTAFRHLVPDTPMRDQLSGVFALDESPVWLDSSTDLQCREREEALGGAQAVAELTGSRAYPRFTGNQIAKVYGSAPSVYDSTERIALVSSFMASLLVGDYAPIDAADGSGMNLMDIRRRVWAPPALACTAPDLDERLGRIVPSYAIVGRLHASQCERFGFSAECAVIAFSGDNPNSLVGLGGPREGEVAISLGTSDTAFGSLAEPRPRADEGHIFVNPMEPDAYMALICYKNGSLTREFVRDEFAGGSWDGFSAALERTRPGNGGMIGFYIREPEITPPIRATGVTRFDAGGTSVSAFPPGADVRAVVEGQMLSMRLHASNIGLTPSSILATGGASTNAAILRIMADVFGVPVCTSDRAGSAALGAAYRALHGRACGKHGAFLPFAEALADASRPEVRTRPDMAAFEAYSAMLPRYTELERRLVAGE